MLPIFAAGIGILLGVTGVRLWADLSGAQRSAPRASDATRGQPQAASEPTPDSLGAELEALRETLTADRRARAELEEEVERLRQELMQLTRDAKSEADTAAAPASLPEAHPRPTARPFFDEEALTALEMDPDEAAWLHGRSDEFEMERLDLLDRATREGWRASPRYRRESQERELAFREELGEDLYDRMLYATGRDNRVTVYDVLSRSPASDAGIDEGDVILRYDDQRVFTVFELQRSTTEGRRGDSVPVELLRNGQPIRVFVPRGPLGVRIRPDRQPPLPER